jgi:hypothetical protein
VDVSIAMPQIDRRVLDRFAAAVGLGRVYGPTRARQKDRPRSKPQYRYATGGHPSIQAICAMLWQWLSPVKREQFRVALTVMRPVSHRRHRPHMLCEHGVRRWKGGCRACTNGYNRQYHATHLGRERAVRRLAVAMLTA